MSVGLNLHTYPLCRSWPCCMVTVRELSPRRPSTAEPACAHQHDFSPLLPKHTAKSPFLASFLIGWHQVWETKSEKTECGQKWCILFPNLAYKNLPRSQLCSHSSHSTVIWDIEGSSTMRWKEPVFQNSCSYQGPFTNLY